MIPFAILSGKIKTKTDEKEIRLLELSPDYFTFRLLKEQAQKYVQQLSDAGQQGNVVLSFFQFQKRSYHEVILNCTRDVVKIELMPQKQMEGLVCEIRVDVKNEEYRIYTERFNKEYLNYIYLKLDETEADMSKALVGYPSEKEQTYSDTLKKQRAAWTQVPNEAKKSLAERVDGIELDNPAWYQAYLSKPLKDFISLYWESSGWIDIDLCKIAWRVPKYFYIGNAYCFHLFPKKTQLEAMLEKTWGDHIFPVCVFAPVEEKDLIKIEKILKLLSDWCQNKCVKIELVINDWGMAGLIRKKYPNQFLLTLGCLLSKQRRDTRMNYVNRNDNEFSKEKSQVDAPFYRQYLAKYFNITRVSFQNSGIDQSFFMPDSMIGMTLHFPYFQMNTSGWCPLLAMLYRGSRGRQKAVDDCHCECMTYAFEYPDFLCMTGRYNSIFGYNDSIRIEKEGVRLVAGFLNTPLKNDSAKGTKL